MIYVIVHMIIIETLAVFVLKNKYKNPNLLNIHMRTHLGQGPFECEWKKKVTIKVVLKTHKKLHSTDKTFSCNFCEIRFVEKDKLVRH